MTFTYRLFLTTFLAFLFGTVIAVTGAHAMKWLCVLAIPFILAVGVVMTRSVLSVLTLALVWSLSTQMCFWLMKTGDVPEQMGVRVSLTGLCSLAWLAVMGFSRRFSELSDVRYHFLRRAVIGMILWMAWASISLVVAQKQAQGFSFFSSALDAFAVYLCGAYLAQTAKGRQWVLRATAFSVMLTCMVAAIQFAKFDFLNFSFMGAFEEPIRLVQGGREIVRPSAFLGHANSMAMYMGAWAPLLVLTFLTGDRSPRLERAYYGAACLAAVAASGIAFSRGGWVALATGVALSFVSLCHPLVRNQYPKSAVKALRIVIGFLAVAALFSPYILGRLTGDDLGSTQSRVQLAQRALENIALHPWFGLGYAYFLGAGHFSLADTPPHNIYLHTASELGIPALLILLFLIINILSHALRQLDRAIKNGWDAHEVIWVSGLAAGFMTVSLHGLLEPGTLGYPRLLSFFFIAGLLSARLLKDPETAST